MDDKEPDNDQRIAALERYLQMHSKSESTALWLAICFGPLGLYYSDWRQATMYTVVACLGMSTLVIPTACWLGAVFSSIYAVQRYNRKLSAEVGLITLLTVSKQE